MMRHLLPLIVIIFATIARGDDFILSYWCGPPAGSDVNERYAEVAKCGFNYAMIPCSGASIENNRQILEACRKNKLKYIPADSRLLQFPSSSPAFKTNLDAVIAEYHRYPAMGGYFLADEPSPGAFPALAVVNQYLLEHDPKHLPFINLYPNYAPEWALGGTYEQHVDNYLTSVKPRLLSFDHYAMLSNGTESPAYFANFEVIRRQSLKHDVPFASIFLVTQFGNQRNPSENDLLWQVNLALIYGAKGLLYFTYYSPTNDPVFAHSNGIIDAKGKRSPHYDMARRINAGVNAWAPTLMKLKSRDLYHTAAVPAGSQALPKDFQPALQTTGNLIVGTFKHDDGSEWLMLMNRHLHTSATATVNLPKVKKVKELTRDKGKLSSCKLQDGVLAVNLEPAVARLFRLPPK